MKNKTNIILILIIVIALGSALFMDNTTAKVTAKQFQEILNPQTPASASLQPQPNIAPTQNTQSNEPVVDTRLETCTQLGNKYTDSSNFIATCMSYMSKFCFDSTQCGPFQCVKNRCQVQ